jgi:hypothetical protein
VGSERVASFVVVSRTHSSDEISDRLDVEPDAAGSDASGAYWEARALGGHDVDLDDLIERVVTRVLPAEPALRALADDGAKCLLRIVAHLSSSDGCGGGFRLRHEHVAFLGRVRAFVDADLYAEDGRVP